LTESTPVEFEASHARRVELAGSLPEIVVDGLGIYNPRLALSAYPELASWMAGYREAGRTGQTVIYTRR